MSVMPPSANLALQDEGRGMACNILYDFVTGAKIQLPTVSRAGTATEEDGRHGVRAILSPNEAARTLIRDQVRMLSELSGATSDG
jgi:hypothetical protein